MWCPRVRVVRVRNGYVPDVVYAASGVRACRPLSVAAPEKKPTRWNATHTIHFVARLASSGATASRPASAHTPSQAPRDTHLTPPQHCSQLRSTSSSTQQHAHHAAKQHTAQQQIAANLVTHQPSSQPHRLVRPVMQHCEHKHTHQLISFQHLCSSSMQQTAPALHIAKCTLLAARALTIDSRPPYGEGREPESSN